MKHFNLLGSLLLSGACLLGGAEVSLAQIQQPLHDNIIGNISGARFMVNTPVNLTGTKKITIADWGGQPIVPLLNKPVVKGIDSLAANPLTNAAQIAGKVCLLYRGGGVNFSQKAAYAATAGAIAVIIVNNTAGDPISMGATPSTFTTPIPVIMVTQADGDAMNAVLSASGSVTVSLGNWSLGAGHDLSIVSAYQATPHATNIPYAQLIGSNGTFPYNYICGGGVANYGTHTEHNIVVTDSIYWTPNGGSAGFVAAHSYSIDSITATDSVKFGFAAQPYTLPVPTGQGRYDHHYTMTYDSVAHEGIPQDNVYSFSHYVTDSIVCKGNYDYTNSRPGVSIGIQPAGGTTPFVFGTMLYLKNGGYASKMQYSLSVNNDPTLDGLAAWGYVFKWTDGLVPPADSFVQAGEISLVGVNYTIFGTGDSSGRGVTAMLTDSLGVQPYAKLDSNGHYWVAVEAPAGSFVGMDRTSSYFSRAYGFFVAGGQVSPSPTADIAEVACYQAMDDARTDGTFTFYNYPFSGNVYYIDSVSFDRYNEIPSVALHMLKSAPPVTGVNNVNKNIGNITLFPNPAKGSTNVSVELTKAAKQVTYKVIDAVGRGMYSETHNNVTNEKFTLDVSNYAAGTYYLLVGSENGVSFKKFTVIK